MHGKGQRKWMLTTTLIGLLAACDAQAPDDDMRIGAGTAAQDANSASSRYVPCPEGFDPKAGQPNVCIPTGGAGEPRGIADGSGACPVASTSDWKAWVNAMPGPNSQPTLIVTGNVTVPTGGYGVGLGLGPTLEMNPPIQQIILRVTPPTGGATQAVVEHEVRGEFPALPTYGAVEIRCGTERIAVLSDIEWAR